MAKKPARKAAPTTKKAPKAKKYVYFFGSGKADGDPQLAIDSLGSRKADTVMLTTDGSAVRDIVGKENTPVRWAVIGIADP